MAKTLKEHLNKNVLLMSLYNSLWQGTPAFKGLFEIDYENKPKAKMGSAEWQSSFYGQDGFDKDINVCIVARKAFYRLFHLICVKKDLGSIYFDKNTNTVTSEYFDEDIDTLNEIIEGNRKNEAYDRKIVMSFKNGIITAGDVSEAGKHSQLKYGTKQGKGEHSFASYIYGYLSWLLACDENDLNQRELEFKKVLNYSLDAAKNGATPSQERLVRLENDVLFLINDRPCKQGGIMPNSDLLEEAKKNGQPFIDLAKKTSSKNNQLVAKPKKLADVVGTKIYDLGHEFKDNNEKKLVPTNYDDILVDENIQDTLMIIKARHDKGMPCNVMYTGEAGTGKTTAAQMLARALGLPYYFLTCCTNTESYDLQYRNAVEDNKIKLVESQVLKAFRDGGVIELQEFNMVRKQSVLTFLNSALDGIGKMETQTGSIVNRHKDCVFVFSMNVGYEGTAPINQALRSRMNIKINFELPDDEILSNELVKISSLDSETCYQMVNCFNEIRTALAEGGEDNGICSRRELSDWASTSKFFMDFGIDEKEAIVKASKETIIPSATDDEDLKTELAEIVGHYWSVI